MAYELKELGWYDEDIKSISSSISGQVMTITITLQNGNTLDTTVTLPEATDAKVTSISNAIVDNRLTTTVMLSDGNSVTSEAVDLPTVNISGKLDKVETTTTSQQAYVKNTDGTQDMVDVSFDETGQTIVKRRNDGSIDCADGTDDKQAATVGQMNTAIAAAQPYRVELIGTSGKLSVEQCNKLKADDSSYILVSPTDVSEQKVKFNKISVEGSTLTYSTETLLDSMSMTILSDGTWSIQEVVCENQSNKINELSASSTNKQYPSAKATYDADQSTLTAAKAYADSILGAEQTWLAKIDSGEGV